MTGASAFVLLRFIEGFIKMGWSGERKRAEEASSGWVERDDEARTKLIGVRDMYKRRESGDVCTPLIIHV